MLDRLTEDTNTSMHDVMQEGFLGVRIPEDDYSPSDITSILSQDYLSEPSTTQSIAFPDMQRKVRWSNWITFTQRMETRMKHSTNSTIKCLDGLRGVACLFVFNFHFLYPYTKTVVHGYGAPVDDGSRVYTFAHQMPYLSIFYRGRAMVSVFFAISGYVLSCKVLRSIRSGDIHSARAFLASSAFRRALRLYIPPTVSMFLVMIAVWAGMFLSEDQIYFGEHAKYVTGLWEEHPPRTANISSQVVHWLSAWMKWSNPFSWQFYYNQYDPHTWSIPIEFRCSIVLFVVLLATTGMKPRWRMLATGFMVLYCLQLARWDIALFIGGMLVCEIDLATRTEATAEHQLSTCTVVESTPFFPPARLRINTNVDDFEKYRKTRSITCAKDDQITMTLRFYSFLVLKWITFIISLYLLSFPESKSLQTPGFSILAKMTPISYSEEFLYLFWHALGAIAVVFSVTNIYPLRVILECAPFQYFGRISFSFYLVHGPILHSVGFMLMPQIFRFTWFDSDDSNNNYIPGHFLFGLALGWVVLFCLSAWCADLFWRFVDIPSTKLARWAERLAAVDEKN